jgi:hypothetical protein
MVNGEKVDSLQKWLQSITQNAHQNMENQEAANYKASEQESVSE